jgi:hypothetical protein
LGRPEGLNFWVQLAAGVLVVLGAVIGVGAAIVHWTQSTLSAETGKLEVVVASPSNRPAEWVSGGGFLQSRATTPQVDLTVRNTGSKPALLTNARITVDDGAWLPVCIVPGAGPVPIAGRYPVSLPFLPNRGERTVEKTLHDEVPAGGVDRLKIYFQAPKAGEDDSVYALHIELDTDGAVGSVDAGRFVLGVPGPVSRSGELLPEDNSLLTSGGIEPNRVASAWCYRHNLSELRRVLGRRGRRTAETAALGQLRPASDWPRYSSGLSAREAVAPLMDDASLSYGPIVAVFAAERTGDTDLIERTRKRAALVLLRRAQGLSGPELNYPMLAIEEAHGSLSLEPSAEAREALARAESQEWEIQEEQEEFALGG